MKPTLNLPKILYPLTKPKQFKVIFGGRGGGKSIGVADLLLYQVSKGAKVGAFREHMNSIDDSVHALFAAEIVRLDVPGFTIQANAISHSSGGSISYKGLAKNPEGIKSMHGFDIFWVEEAATLSKRSIDLLIPTLRKANAELFITFNPASSADPTSLEFLKPFEDKLVNGVYEDDLHTVIKINYSDNPFFPDTLEKLRLQHKATKPRAEYQHVWEGEYNDSVDDAIISTEWFDAAIAAHTKLGITPSGATVFSHDPADTGFDSKGYAIRRGIYFHDVGEIEAVDGNSGCDIACDLAIAGNTDLFIFDADGMGALLRRQIAKNFEGIKTEIRGYKGSMAVENKNAVYDGLQSLSSKDKPKTNRDTFFNKRAQYYMKLAQRFYNTWRAVEKGEYVNPDDLISINPDLPLLAKLRSEVCRIPRKPNGSGKIQLMSKDEMLRKHQIQSPGMADCLAMCMEIPDLATDYEEIDFAGWGS